VLSGSIARRYAKALLGIGIEKQSYEALGRELDQFTALLHNRELTAALENPSHALSKRKAVLASVIDRIAPSPTTRSFLLLLLDRGRLEHLPGIAREYRVMADEHAGRIRADVVSAHTLSPQAVARLKRALEQRTGKQVLLEQRTDPELIAGMVTRIGGVVYDGSVRTRLEQLRGALLAERG